jgi:hypothetical protein
MMDGRLTCADDRMPFGATLIAPIGRANPA